MKTSYKNISILWLIALYISAFSSCKKTTDIRVMGTAPGRVVIEANLTNNIDSLQYVRVSYAQSASDTIPASPAINAVVTVTDGNSKSYDFVQVASGTYLLRSLKTNPGETYTLTVKVDNKVYTASSQMPKIDVNIDTMSIARVNVGNNTYRAVNLFFFDPGSSDNQYRLVMSVNGVQSKTIFVMNNELVKGKYAYMMLIPYDINLKVGDVVDVEIQCIDKNNYNYWYTLSQQQSSATLALDNTSKSVNPISNFNNGSLGYFSAHTCHLKRYTIYGSIK